MVVITSTVSYEITKRATSEFSIRTAFARRSAMPLAPRSTDSPYGRVIPTSTYVGS